MSKNDTTYFRFLFIGIVVLFISRSGFSQEIPKKMNENKAVQDYIQLLSGNEQRLLNNKLKNYADTTSTGIVIAIRNDVQDDINFYAAQMLTDWGIGQQGKDNGILLLLDTNQRQIAISTGYGVEHLLTDALSRRIIENVITPEFKQGKFYEGLDKGTSAIMQVMSGEYTGKPQRVRGDENFPIGILFLFFIVLIIILSNRKRGGRGNRGNRRNTTGSILEAIILSNAGRGGFGGGGFGGSSGGGFGGGGFGGFGGGMGGGGGASGGW